MLLNPFKQKKVMKLNAIGFIGGGRITRIFLNGFKNKSVRFETLKVFEPDVTVLKSLVKKFPEIKKAAIVESAAVQPLVVISVHPSVVPEILKKMKDVVDENTVVVSLAPKITIKKMAEVLPTKKLVRMIPSATSFINKGFNPVAFHPEMEEKDKKQIAEVFKPLGKIFETEESKLESYAIISAMLPTYFWFQWLEIEKIAGEIGLSSKEARKAVWLSIKKSADLFYNSGLTQEEVMDLIPVKPINDAETQITDIFDTHLMKFYNKIKP